LAEGFREGLGWMGSEGIFKKFFKKSFEFFKKRVIIEGFADRSEARR
jgi:hypothetical protein